MRKLVTIMREEYRRHVLRKQFIGVLLMPLIMIGVGTIVGFIIVTSTQGDKALPAGLVDPAGVLPAAVVSDGITFTRMAPAAARAALETGSVSAIYVLDPDFRANGKVTEQYWKDRPDSDIRNAFERSARDVLLTGVSAQTRARLTAGADFIYETPDRSRHFGKDNILGFILPLVIGIAAVIAITFGGQYLLNAVIDEKENRTIEVMLSSVTPVELMGGKILGLTGVVFTQLAVWAAGAGLAFALLRDKIPLLRTVDLPPSFFAMMPVMFFLQFLLFAALFAAIGSAMVDQKQGQQFAGPLTLLALTPQFFLPALLIDPNGAIAIALSLFPFTAPYTLALRYGMTAVPLWQPGLAIVIEVLAAAGAIWLASRIFHIGLLRFGQKVPLSDLFDAVRK